MNPMFSVIIPAYNAGKFLEKAVDSVLNQDFDDYELIIVDDGSTDNTLEICNTYAEKFKDKVIVITQSNKGLSGARSSGMKRANGEYLLFLDADDYIEPNSLSTLSDRIIQLNYPDIVIFVFFFFFFPWTPSDNLLNSVLDRNYI